MQIILDRSDLTPELIEVLFKCGKAEPTKAEPTKKSKTTKAEPVKAEPIKAEPITAEPITAEPIKAEPTKAEPTKAEPVVISEDNSGSELVQTIETKGYTLNDLKKAAADLIASGKVQIKTLQELNEVYKIRSLTELKADRINDYAANLIGLGASL